MIDRREFASRAISMAAATAAPKMESEPALGVTAVHRLQQWLDERVATREVTGLVAALSDASSAHNIVAGHQDLESRVAMRPDTLFRVASITKPITTAAAMMLVDDGLFGLDEPVDRWLPELRNRRVVRHLEGSLEDTVPASRPITLRDLLTMRMGLGAIFADPSKSPLLKRMVELGVAPRASPMAFGSDEFMRRLAGLPLAYQPGERWLYHTGLDVAGVLIERASGMTLEKFLTARLFGPIGMTDSSFSLMPDRLNALATVYSAEAGKRFVARDGLFLDPSRPPAMQLGGGGLISTARDFLAFGRLLLNRGMCCGRQLLSQRTVALMTMDQIATPVKAASPFYPGFWDSYGWGLGMAVSTASSTISRAGRFGWWGGTGTSFFADPSTNRVAVLMTQRMMTAPDDLSMSSEFQRQIFRS